MINSDNRGSTVFSRLFLYTAYKKFNINPFKVQMHTTKPRLAQTIFTVPHKSAHFGNLYDFYTRTKTQWRTAAQKSKAPLYEDIKRRRSRSSSVCNVSNVDTKAAAITSDVDTQTAETAKKRRPAENAENSSGEKWAMISGRWSSEESNATPERELHKHFSKECGQVRISSAKIVLRSAPIQNLMSYLWSWSCGRFKFSEFHHGVCEKLKWYRVYEWLNIERYRELLSRSGCK